MSNALIALGGNVADVRATFRSAIDRICERAQAALLARSSDYQTPPWGDEDQSPFINACIAIETPLAPQALLHELHQIERQFGRERINERRWGPRTLDLDILAYDDLVLKSDELELPHPRLYDRAFVLVPLVEIAPDRLIANTTPRRALADLATDGIVRLEEAP